jgi:carbon monoxide dehydrogenase subunit G
MKIEGSHTLAAARPRVFAMLFDPEVLKRAVPGCEEITPAGENAFRISMKAGLATIRGKVAGEIRIEESRPPEHYRLSMKGKGMGSVVDGWADLDLTETPEGTEVHYAGEANIGGMIAAVGNRLIELAVRKALNDFFARIAQEASAP